MYAIRSYYVSLQGVLLTPCINVRGNVLMISESTYQSLYFELEKAITFNNKGEENKSRVLARQIAGKAVREILREIDFLT